MTVVIKTAARPERPAIGSSSEADTNIRHLRTLAPQPYSWTFPRRK